VCVGYALARLPSQLGSTLVTATNVPSISASCVHTSGGSWRCKVEHGKHQRVAGSTLSVPFVLLFIRTDPETTESQGHSITTQLQHPPSLPRSRSTNTHNERRRARDRSKVPSRCKRGEARNVHQKEMLEDPLIIVRGEELVAPDPTACEHHPAAWSGPAPADRNRTAGAAVAPSSSSACSIWTPWMLTAIPAQASRCRT